MFCNNWGKLPSPVSGNGGLLYVCSLQCSRTLNKPPDNTELFCCLDPSIPALKRDLCFVCACVRLSVEKRTGLYLTFEFAARVRQARAVTYFLSGLNMLMWALVNCRPLKYFCIFSAMKVDKDGRGVKPYQALFTCAPFLIQTRLQFKMEYTGKIPTNIKLRSKINKGQSS